MIYYLVNTEHPFYQTFIIDCKKDLPADHRLSITENLDKKKALIKTSSLFGTLPEGFLVDSYKRKDIKEVYKFIYTSEWSLPDEPV